MTDGQAVFFFFFPDMICNVRIYRRALGERGGERADFAKCNFKEKNNMHVH